MRYPDASCPYCGTPVIMDKKGVGLCEYCGQYIVWDDCSGRYVLESTYKASLEKGRHMGRNPFHFS